MLVSKTKYNELVKYVVESYNKELEEERNIKLYIRKKGKSFKLYVVFRKIVCYNSL